MGTTVLGPLPFSELVGGCVSGYLHGRRGVRAGALSGVFAAVPRTGLLFAAAVFSGFVPVDSGSKLSFQFLVILVTMIAFLGAVGALAGYVGAYLHRNRRVRTDTGSPDS